MVRMESGATTGKAVMVPKTAPGDTVAARIVENKERYSVGEIVRILKPSSLRQEPPCPYVAQCGGCPWQHVGYESPAMAKAKECGRRAAVASANSRDSNSRPIIASPLTYNYRRRIRLQRDGSKRLGFFTSFSHHLIEIDRCLIADDKLNRLIEQLRRWSEELITDVEHLEVVTGDQPNEIVIVGQSAGAFISRDRSTCGRLLKKTS